MPLVNILPILIVLSMTKIICSHKFMMEKVFNVNSSHLQKEIDLKTNKTSKPAK